MAYKGYLQPFFEDSATQNAQYEGVSESEEHQDLGLKRHLCVSEQPSSTRLRIGASPKKFIMRTKGRTASF